MEQVAKRDIRVELAAKWGISEANLMPVTKATIFKGDAAKASDEELVAFLMVCNRYDLNPFLRQIHAFLGRSGGIVPIVGVDGWVDLVNREPKYDGVTFEDHLAEGKLQAITCRIYIKGREHTVQVTEYLQECFRDTEPWKKWPYRMLRHKSFIQCARIAFGYSGIYDEDEGQRIIEAEATAVPVPLSVKEAKALAGPSGGQPAVIEAPQLPATAPAAPPAEPPQDPLAPPVTVPPADHGPGQQTFPATPVPPGPRGYPRGRR